MRIAALTLITLLVPATPVFAHSVRVAADMNVPSTSSDGDVLRRMQSSFDRYEERVERLAELREMAVRQGDVTRVAQVDELFMTLQSIQDDAVRDARRSLTSTARRTLDRHWNTAQRSVALASSSFAGTSTPRSTASREISTHGATSLSKRADDVDLNVLTPNDIKESDLRMSAFVTDSETFAAPVPAMIDQSRIESVTITAMDGALPLVGTVRSSDRSSVDSRARSMRRSTNTTLWERSREAQRNRVGSATPENQYGELVRNRTPDRSTSRRARDVTSDNYEREIDRLARELANDDR